jgi:hypothetical protein
MELIARNNNINKLNLVVVRISLDNNVDLKKY